MPNRIVRLLVLGAALLTACNSDAEAAGLPDILGIQLGMPAREAHAKLQSQLPKNKIEVQSTNLPTIDKPIITSFVANPAEQISMGMEGDMVSVDVTLPPNKQAVWRVGRRHLFPGKGIPKTTLLASLREKYGKETFSNVQQGKRAADDSKIQSLLWLFDEQGRPAALPPPTASGALDNATLASLATCISGSFSSANLGVIEVYAEQYKGKNPQNDWCYVHYTAVYVTVTESVPPELYSQMQLEAVSMPFLLQATEVTLRWKKDIAAGQHRQDLEKANQQEKPKL